MRHRAPVPDAQAGVVDHDVRELVGDVVGHGGGFGHERVDPVLDHGREEARGHRGRGQVELQDHRPALRVERAGELVVARRPVEVVGHVVFARPHQLDRPAAHGLGDLHRLRDVVHVDAPSEAAAQEGGAHGDLLGLEAGDLGGHAFRELLELRGSVDEAGVLPHVGREVHRLHGGVGEERQLVVGLHGLGRALEPPRPRRPAS